MFVPVRGTRRPNGILPLLLLSLTFLWMIILPPVQINLQKQGTPAHAYLSSQPFSTGFRYASNLAPSVFHPRIADFELTPLAVNSTPPPVSWDEQLGLTISQNSPSLSYNVTAVEQTDSDGYGPAYLLNGLTNAGGWYQVGLAYDWPVDQGGYASGFTFLYEVFNSSGISVYPSDGGGGLMNYSGQINPGDTVLLNLSFTGNQVMMYSHDWSTGASAIANYTSDGGAYFAGLQTANNNIGFFSGPMTEQYHVSPYNGSEASVTYSNPYVGLNAATMWIDEYNINTNQTLFSVATADLPYTNPNQLLSLDANGTSVQSDSYEFITGSNALVSVTMSYEIAGGGSGYKAPVLNYVSDGVAVNTSLTMTPTEFFMDKGTTWSVTDPLNGSSPSQRWITAQPNGTVTSAQTISLTYTHEFNLTFSVTPLGSGKISPSISAWYEDGTLLNLTATPEGSFLFSSWTANSTELQFGNITAATTTVTIYGTGRIVAEFSTFSLSLSSYTGSAIEGSSISDIARIVGENGSVTMSISGLPTGATGTWANNTVSENVNGANDGLNISTSFTTPSGIYNLTVTGISGNVSNSVQFTLTIEAADPLTVSYTVNDGSSLSAPPMLTYVYDGQTSQVPVTPVAEVVYVDNGTTWQITSSPNGSTSQRWIAGSPTTGIASSASNINVLYYHQFLVAFTSSSLVNETIASNEFPSVNFTSVGEAASISANGSQVWADAGTSFTYPTVIAMTGVERLVLSGNGTGQITGPVTASEEYTQEYLVEASFGLNYSTSSSTILSPELSFEQNGSAATASLTRNGVNYWMDSGSSWSVSANLSGSTLVRWIGNNTSGDVISTTAIRPDYTPQFYVTIDQNVPSAGSVSAENGWHTANTSISLDATPNQGWNFEGWTGEAGTFNQSSTTIMVKSPLNETALFYPSLVISAAPNGVVTYSYGSTSGTVTGGSSTTLYVPPNTNVSLSASSSSEFYTPGSWSVGNDSSSAPSAFTLLVNSPTSVGISFNLDVTMIALIAAVVVGLLASVIFIVFRRKGGNDLSVGTSHSWKW